MTKKYLIAAGALILSTSSYAAPPDLDSPDLVETKEDCSLSTECNRYKCGPEGKKLEQAKKCKEKCQYTTILKCLEAAGMLTKF